MHVTTIETKNVNGGDYFKTVFMLPLYANVECAGNTEMKHFTRGCRCGFFVTAAKDVIMAVIN